MAKIIDCGHVEGYCTDECDEYEICVACDKEAGPLKLKAKPTKEGPSLQTPEDGFISEAVEREPEEDTSEG